MNNQKHNQKVSQCDQSYGFFKDKSEQMGRINPTIPFSTPSSESVLHHEHNLRPRHPQTWRARAHDPRRPESKPSWHSNLSPKKCSRNFLNNHCRFRNLSIFVNIRTNSTFIQISKGLTKNYESEDIILCIDLFSIVEKWRA